MIIIVILKVLLQPELTERHFVRKLKTEQQLGTKHRDATTRRLRQRQTIGCKVLMSGFSPAL